MCALHFFQTGGGISHACERTDKAVSGMGGLASEVERSLRSSATGAAHGGGVKPLSREIAQQLVREEALGQTTGQRVSEWPCVSLCLALHAGRQSWPCESGSDWGARIDSVVEMHVDDLDFSFVAGEMCVSFASEDISAVALSSLLASAWNHCERMATFFTSRLCQGLVATTQGNRGSRHALHSFSKFLDILQFAIDMDPTFAPLQPLHMLLILEECRLPATRLEAVWQENAAKVESVTNAILAGSGTSCVQELRRMAQDCRAIRVSEDKRGGKLYESFAKHLDVLAKGGVAEEAIASEASVVPSWAFLVNATASNHIMHAIFAPCENEDAFALQSDFVSSLLVEGESCYVCLFIVAVFHIVYRADEEIDKDLLARLAHGSPLRSTALSSNGKPSFKTLSRLASVLDCLLSRIDGRNSVASWSPKTNMEANEMPETIFFRLATRAMHPEAELCNSLISERSASSTQKTLAGLVPGGRSSALRLDCSMQDLPFPPFTSLALTRVVKNAADVSFQARLSLPYYRKLSQLKESRLADVVRIVEEQVLKGKYLFALDLVTKTLRDHFGHTPSTSQRTSHNAAVLQDPLYLLSLDVEATGKQWGIGPHIGELLSCLIQETHKQSTSRAPFLLCILDEVLVLHHELGCSISDKTKLITLSVASKLLHLLHQSDSGSFTEAFTASSFAWYSRELRFLVAFITQDIAFSHHRKRLDWNEASASITAEVTEMLKSVPVVFPALDRHIAVYLSKLQQMVQDIRSPEAAIKRGADPLVFDYRTLLSKVCYKGLCFLGNMGPEGISELGAVGESAFDEALKWLESVNAQPQRIYIAKACDNCGRIGKVMQLIVRGFRGAEEACKDDFLTWWLQVVGLHFVSYGRQTLEWVQTLSAQRCLSQESLDTSVEHGDVIFRDVTRSFVSLLAGQSTDYKGFDTTASNAIAWQMIHCYSSDLISPSMLASPSNDLVGKFSAFKFNQLDPRNMASVLKTLIIESNVQVDAVYEFLSVALFIFCENQWNGFDSFREELVGALTVMGNVDHLETRAANREKLAIGALIAFDSKLLPLLQLCLVECERSTETGSATAKRKRPVTPVDAVKLEYQMALFAYLALCPWTTCNNGEAQGVAESKVFQSAIAAHLGSVVGSEPTRAKAPIQSEKSHSSSSALSWVHEFLHTPGSRQHYLDHGFLPFLCGYFPASFGLPMLNSLADESRAGLKENLLNAVCQNWFKLSKGMETCNYASISRMAFKSPAFVKFAIESLSSPVLQKRNEALRLVDACMCKAVATELCNFFTRVGEIPSTFECESVLATAFAFLTHSDPQGEKGAASCFNAVVVEKLKLLVACCEESATCEAKRQTNARCLLRLLDQVCRSGSACIDEHCVLEIPFVDMITSTRNRLDYACKCVALRCLAYLSSRFGKAKLLYLQIVCSDLLDGQQSVWKQVLCHLPSVLMQQGTGSESKLPSLSRCDPGTGTAPSRFAIGRLCNDLLQSGDKLQHLKAQQILTVLRKCA